MGAPDAANPRFGRGTREAIVRIARDLRTRGKVIWPWPPSLVIDDRDVDIETYLVAAMNYIKALVASDMPRCEHVAADRLWPDREWPAAIAGTA